MNSMLDSIMCNPGTRPGRSAVPFEELLRARESGKALAELTRAAGRTDVRMGLLDSARRDFFPLLICRAPPPEPRNLSVLSPLPIFSWQPPSSLSLSLPLVFLFFHSWRGKREECPDTEQRRRKGEHASLAPSKPPSAIFPPSPFHPESLSQERGREGEMEEEDMVRSRKPLALPPGWQGRRMAVACVRVRVRARDFGNAMISGTN